MPGKFLELILLELKKARIVESIRGAKGGYQLRRPPSEIRLSEVFRLIDGPLAPFGDADQLRVLIARDADHRALYQVLLDVRDAAARILENASLADITTTGNFHVPSPTNAAGDSDSQGPGYTPIRSKLSRAWVICRVYKTDHFPKLKSDILVSNAKHN